LSTSQSERTKELSQRGLSSKGHESKSKSNQRRRGVTMTLVQAGIYSQTRKPKRRYRCKPYNGHTSRKNSSNERIMASRSVINRKTNCQWSTKETKRNKLSLMGKAKAIEGAVVSVVNSETQRLGATVGGKPIDSLPHLSPFDLSSRGRSTATFMMAAVFGFVLLLSTADSLWQNRRTGRLASRRAWLSTLDSTSSGGW
jgi:hypothetical protein